ncbi:MAG: Nif3-like dinuclear metal center hexameric protein [Thermoleophilia bacterium]
MSIKVEDFLAVIERLAPVDLAEDWDNCGLQAGARDAGVSSVLAAVDITDAVLDEAVDLGCDLVLAHHPMIFKPLAAVSDDSRAGRLTQKALAAGITVVAAHTNLDAAPGGLADVMARMLGLVAVEPVAAAARESSFKLVVFVPPSDLEPVRQALFTAGAGIIGDYRHCSWYAAGTGTFLPGVGARPVIGKVGADESVEEFRLETVVSGGALDGAVVAMLAAHSYEEPAYDIYPLTSLKPGVAAGRVGALPEAMSAPDLAGKLAGLFGVDAVSYTAPAAAMVRRVAVVPGSGAGFIASLGDAIDVLVTGDYKYHDVQLADELGIGLIELPHDVSEGVALRHWLPVLERELAGTGVRLRMSSVAASGWQSAGVSQTEAKPVVQERPTGGYRLHVDGGARGNPGPAGIGAVLLDGDGAIVAELAETIGEATNNVAEYKALIAGVVMALEQGVTSLDVYSDSELVIKQLQGSYKVKNEGLKPLYREALSGLGRLDSYRLFAVPREKNAHADALVNKALDEASR